VNNTRANQGGSVVSFVVVGVILVGLVAGGVYLLKQRNDNTSNSRVATTSKAPSPSASVAAPAPSKSAQPSQPPASNQKPAAGTVTPPATGSTQTVIPQTGPSDMIPGGIVLATVLSATVAFTQSVRARRRLFNQ
jgi:hypothetical protein